ncbi:uncharacterized protein LOC143286967 isoform X2 [Babylonia areolata]|uniref:uncharacterized protein LOC143286967 isoform X2 n=1 Tax=Babylonia areolata TaxID=304850 RepID=UPI003FD121D2
MGKDHELLEAARTGNLQTVKTILSGKLPRSGPGGGGGWRSILALKSVNINCTDTSGETPVHLAALNGHRDVVVSLLEAKASVTEVDSKGCTPLHLAAWNGHTAICELLLHYASDKSIVNAQTNEGETPLHFAAQHGHHDVVSLLLQNKADPTLRTLTERSALDLAAQYGKTSVVRTLVSGRHELLTHVSGQPSPLHLAAFNGHLPIVGFLLDSGFLVNTRTDNGTALHEAATSCKLDVIKLLLDRGVDVCAKAKNNLTAEDILRRVNSKLTTKALQIISSHVNSQRTPDSDGERDINGIPGPSHTARLASPASGRRPIPKPRSVYGESLESALFRQPDRRHTAYLSVQTLPPEPHSPPPPLPPRISLRNRRVDIPDRNSTPVTDTGQSRVVAEELNKSRDASPMTGPREQPKKPPRKNPSLRKQDNPHNNSPNPNPNPNSAPPPPPPTDSTTTSSTTGNEPLLPSTYDKPLPLPPPCAFDSPRKDYANVDMDRISSVLQAECGAASASSEVKDVVANDPCDEGGGSRGEDAAVKEGGGGGGGGDDDDVEGAACGGEEGADGGGGGESDDSATSAAKLQKKRESLYANVVMLEEEKAKANKPRSLELEGSKGEDSGDAATEDEGGQPLSPSNYSQPPTPDYPPPSPSTALQGIQQKINPMDKRKSKDIETLTESTLLQSSTGSATDSNQKPQATDSEVAVPRKKEKPAVGVAGAVGVGAAGDASHEFLRGEQQHLSQGLEPVEEEKSTTTTNTATTAATTANSHSRKSRNKDINNLSSHSSVMTMSDAGGKTTVEMEGDVIKIRRSVSSGDNPVDWDPNIFAGLLRGSTPGGSRNVVSQICENVVIKTVLSKRHSTHAALVTFDPVMESREENRMTASADYRVLGEEESRRNSGARASSATSSAGRGPASSRNSLPPPSQKSDEIFDDSEEWAKIADIVSSFGGRIGSSGDYLHGDLIPELDPELEKLLTERGENAIQSVGEWLDSLGMGQYENTLVANGFDDTDFLGGTIIEDTDLAAIGITNEEHRTTIVNAAHKMSPVESIDAHSFPESVEKWLEGLRLGQYIDTFISHTYTTMPRVLQLWELELNTVLDITSLGHRKRILASLGDRPHIERDPSFSPARTQTQKREAAAAEEEEEEPRSPFDHVDLYRDYTGVKPQAAGSGGEQTSREQHADTLTTDDKTEEDNGRGCHQDSEIHIRPPHLMHTTGSIRQWRHQPEILIKGCCNYTAHYLGSTVVKELKGAISTQEGIAKLKKSTEVLNKIPTIMLSISYKGVKFIDGKSKKVVCDHEIANIFCACQDGEHMNFFAYVTKDKETSRHYCHVFSVRNRELAGEIILTLGEAFEIAYQMALKEKAGEGEEEEEDSSQLDQPLSQSDPDDSASMCSKASISTV